MNTGMRYTFGRSKGIVYPFPSAGIIHRYNFEETSGTVSNDLVGTEDGIIDTSLVTFDQPGYLFNTKAYLIKEQNGIPIQHNTFLSGLSEFSVYLRFKRLQTFNSNFEYHYFTGWAGSNAILLRDQLGVHAFNLVTSSGRVDLNIPRITNNNVWDEFLITYDGTEMTLQNSIDSFVSAPQTGTINTPNYYQIGGIGTTAFKSRFEFDELIFWNRALSLEERNGTFKLPKP